MSARDGEPTGLPEPVRAFLVQRRVTLGMNQRDLARWMRTGQAQISLLESGRIDPHLSMVLRWCEALGVSPWLNLLYPSGQQSFPLKEL